MELYLFVWGTLAWTVTLAALWPVNIPLAYLAYRIWSRNVPPPDTEWSEIWLRSTLVALVIAGIALGLVLLDYLLIEWVELPPGPVHLTVYAFLVGLAVWMLMLFYEVEDFFDALSLFIIYVYLPVMVLWALNAVLGFWNPLLELVNNWLVRPRA